MGHLLGTVYLVQFSQWTAIAVAGTETGSCDVSVIAKSDACSRGSIKKRKKKKSVQMYILSLILIWWPSPGNNNIEWYLKRVNHRLGGYILLLYNIYYTFIQYIFMLLYHNMLVYKFIVYKLA